MLAKRSLLIGTFVFEQTAPALAARGHPTLLRRESAELLWTAKLPKGECMRRIIRYLIPAASIVVMFLALTSAQFGAVAGVVKDSSGAVLPGVTVEAASPVLIEKSRTAVSDEAGQYRVEQLRPGLYTVTFTLPGFRAIRR